MKVCTSTSELIPHQKHRCINGQRQIRNTSDIYSNRSTGHPYRTTTTRSQSPGRSQETVCTTKFPSSDNSQSNRYPAQSPLRPGCSYCSVCAVKRPHKSSAARRGSNRGSPRGKQKTFRVGGTSYVGRVDSDATN